MSGLVEKCWGRGGRGEGRERGSERERERVLQRKMEM
jgi:hypothetical protein